MSYGYFNQLDNSYVYTTPCKKEFTYNDYMMCHIQGGSPTSCYYKNKDNEYVSGGTQCVIANQINDFNYVIPQYVYYEPIIYSPRRRLSPRWDRRWSPRRSGGRGGSGRRRR